MGALVFRLRFALYNTLLISVSFFAVFIGVIANLAGQRYNTNYYVARTFYYVAGPIIGWKYVVEGEEHFAKSVTGEQPAVIVGNHQR